MRVKICGITSVDEARIAVSSGADALGFLIGLNYPSDDEIDFKIARNIISDLPPFIASVLVTHRTEVSWVAEMCKKIGCDTVQLHGDLPLEEIPTLRRLVPYVRVIKAVHVVDASAVALAVSVARWADAIQPDTKTATRIGGTGITHDWSISARIVKEVKKPVVLSGGLNPENVHDAIMLVSPFAVDVNSGVENPDGSKSLEKVKSFIWQAKEVREQPGQEQKSLSGPSLRYARRTSR